MSHVNGKNVWIIKSLRMDIDKDSENNVHPLSQTEVTPTVLGFVQSYTIFQPEDLVVLINHMKSSLVFREYNEKSKTHADSIQWKRTATEILNDGYVYKGKACSDLCIVLVALCKALNLESQIVKLVNLGKNSTHSLVEVRIQGLWYRIDPTFAEPKPFQGRLEKDQIWNKEWNGGWKLWQRGDDLWSIGLTGIDKEKIIFENM